MTKKEHESHEKSTKLGKKLTIGQKMRSLNILYPWFKVAVGVLVLTLVGVVIVGEVRHSQSGVGENKTVGEETVEDVAVDEKTGNVESDREQVARRTVGYVASKPTGLLEKKFENKKLIALTFDDGPAPATTLRLLDILKEKKAKATFFVIGRMAQTSPEILKREEGEGHSVGSHTMGHVNLSTLDITKIQQDVAEIDGVFQTHLGHGTRMTRPPYGAVNETVEAGIQQPLVIWTIDPEDWKVKDAAAVHKHVVERAFDGAIVLLHDIYGTTVDAVGGIIDDLRKQGYEFVTVPELAQARGVSLEKGMVYGSFRP